MSVLAHKKPRVPLKYAGGKADRNSIDSFKKSLKILPK
jgi:hypothetical protein